MAEPMRLGATLVLLLLLAPLLSGASASAPRSTTVWSGIIELPDGYLVESNQVLVIQAGTQILVGDGERIGVDGRISIEGTASSPVAIDSSIGKHGGIQFNSSSKNLGSTIENLSIVNSEFGITVYGSDPWIANLTVSNADRVAVDLFDGASPIITDLVIDGGGQDLHGSSLSWRYGIGISSGSLSSPIIHGASISNVITRGVNLWYNSGGLWDGLSIHNVSGATLAAAAGIWVEDSIPLFTNSNVTRSDNGIIVRHISQDATTRPTFLNTKVEDCQYRGVLVERFDHTNYSNLQTNAIFEDLEIRGTGGPGAKTPGLGIGAAFDLNTSGVRVTNAIIEDNPLVGFRAYTTDSSTYLSNLTIRDNGPIAPLSAHEGAGVLFRSTSWTTKGPAEVHGLLVENSSGSGVVMAKGGVIGSDWTVRDNSANGVTFLEFHPRVSNLVSEGNFDHGVYVSDSGNVELSSVHTSGNGIGSSDGAGIFFSGSNYVTSGGKNVSCNSCTSDGDQRGVVVRDSIDLQLISTTITSAIEEPALDIDNSGTIFPGYVILDDLAINSDSSNYTVLLNEVDAQIDGLDLSGQGGMLWVANGDLPSIFSNSVIHDSDSHCLSLDSHDSLVASRISLICEELPVLIETFVNFTESSLVQDSSASSTFMLKSNSHLRWISSGPIETPQYEEEDTILDVMWGIEVHTINQNLLNIPFAAVNISFEQFESELFANQPYEGVSEYGPFIGQRWTPLQGWSSTNSAFVGCEYDGVHNDSDQLPLDSDETVFCRIELSNQPPFIQWETPIEGEEFPSGSEIIFDASNSWDLDFDDLAYTWTSNIDGDLIDSCSSQETVNSSFFTANQEGSEYCLSDGSQEVTLEVCDATGQCVNETRNFVLVNQPPVLSVSTSPSISSWGTLYLGETASVTIDLNGTFDPEGSGLWCWAEASYEAIDPDPDNPYCPSKIVRSFTDSPDDSFSVSVIAWDGVNDPISWTFSVELYNELPEPNMSITRNGPTSSDWVLLDGSESIDPEGDDLKFEFVSDLDGLLASGISSEVPVEWSGTLSKGTHSITLRASDSRPEHSGQWETTSQTVEVGNSQPFAKISGPQSGLLTDSSEMITLDSTGSGDWDLACEDLPDNGVGLLCDPLAGESKDLVSIIWESDMFGGVLLGSSWDVETRLPAGEHRITLTLDDGSGPVSDQIDISVSESAPILVLESPAPDIEVLSNLPVLFDFRESVDMDGDQFTVSVTSDIMGTILDSKTSELWYNDYLVAGVHNLTFVLTDEGGMERTHTQGITVLETGPIAVISGMENGQYVPPGQQASISATQSFDFDDDIVLYEWSIDGDVVSDRESLNATFPPGPVRIDLLVRDSRGATSTTSVNLTVGSSAPELFDLMVSVQRVESGIPTDVITTVRLVDLDGTTETVRGQLIYGGQSDSMYFRDDGTNGDQQEGDGIWTSSFPWVVSGGSWARVEAWAIDGDLVSPGQVHTVPIVDPDGGIESWVASFGAPFLVLSIIALSFAGALYRRRSMAEIAKDMEVIEAWSSFEPSEADAAFDSED